jgi:hypothetical protein
MQVFYWDTAYLAFQRGKLAELNVAAVANLTNSRKVRILGEKRARKDHNLYASNLRRHAEASNLKKPKLSDIKANAQRHRERKDNAERVAASRQNRRAASAPANEIYEDVLNATDPIDWGSQQPSQPVQHQQASQQPSQPVSNHRLWSTFVVPPGLRPSGAAVQQEARHPSSEEDIEFDSNDLALEFAEKIHAEWLSQPESNSPCIVRITDETTWAFNDTLPPDVDKWAFTGHLLSKNVSHATLLKTDHLFFIGRSERKRGFKTLVCKASIRNCKEKALIPDDYETSLTALAQKNEECGNDLWSGKKRRTSTKRIIHCKVQLRLSCNTQNIWHACISPNTTHDHAPTAPSARVVIPAAAAEQVSSAHVEALMTVTQAARLCEANCRTFIPRSAIRRLLKNCVSDTSWGQGGQAGLLLELMLNPSNDICAQFIKARDNKVLATVTVSRLDLTWAIVEGGILQARKEYIGMVLTLKRLQVLHRRHSSPELQDRIAAASVALSTRIAPDVEVDIAPGWSSPGDHFQVSKDSHPALLELNAVLCAAFGERTRGTHIRLAHIIWCTPQDRAHAMMHPHKIAFDTTCKTNAARKHFGYVSGNTTNHNWFKW